jgi:hypothetical protein
MKTPSSDNEPVYSLATRKAIVVLLALPILVIFTVMLLHHKAIINVENLGIPENYLYFGGLAVILAGVIPIVVAWRCPNCRSYLGKEFNPRSCPHCGARFQ